MTEKKGGWVGGQGIFFFLVLYDTYSTYIRGEYIYMYIFILLYH